MREFIPAFLSNIPALATSFAWWIAVSGVLYFLERRWPAGPHAPLGHRLFNLSLGVVASVTLVAIMTAVPVATYVVALLGVKAPLLGGWTPTEWWQWVAGAVVFAFGWDFYQYWFHRAEHAFAPLWALHALHHDSETFNSTDAVRNTVWGGFLLNVIVGIPIAIVGAGNLLHAVAATVLFSVWGFYNHSNVRFGHGPLTLVVSGPQYHRIHHDRRWVRRDKNFAAFFPIIDRMFGTYEAPVASDLPVTGVAGRRPSGGGIGALVGAMLAVPSGARRVSDRASAADRA